MTFIMKFKDNLKSSFLVATFRHCLFTPTMTVYKGRYEFSQKPLCLRCRDHLCHRFPIPLNHRLRRMGIKKVNWTVYFWYQVMSFEKSSYGEYIAKKDSSNKEGSWCRFSVKIQAIFQLSVKSLAICLSNFISLVASFLI